MTTVPNERWRATPLGPPRSKTDYDSVPLPPLPHHVAFIEELEEYVALDDGARGRPLCSAVVDGAPCKAPMRHDDNVHGDVQNLHYRKKRKAKPKREARPGYKICGGPCRQELPVSDFYMRKTGYLYSYCRKCDNRLKRDWKRRKRGG